MKIFLIVGIGAAAVGAMWYFTRNKVRATNPAMQPPVLQAAGDPRKATSITSTAGCVLGGAATAAFIAPPAAPLGCAVGAYLAPKVVAGAEYAAGKVASGAESAWHSVTSLF